MKNVTKVLFYTLLMGISILLIYFVVYDVRPIPNNSIKETSEKITNKGRGGNRTIELAKHLQSELELLQFHNSSIPDYVLATLLYVRAEGKAPNDFVGGRTFQNRERRLPKLKNDTYREWDVHPKKQSQNRGAERLVTSSTDSYYTKDHYNSFIPIKE